MKNTIQYTFIGLLLLIGFSLAAQTPTWEERKENAQQKTMEEIGGRSSTQLKEIISSYNDKLVEQAGKLLEIEELFKQSQGALADNIKQLRIQKAALKSARAANPNSTQVKSILMEIEKLSSKHISLKNAYKKSLKSRNSFVKTVNVLKDKILKNKRALRLLSGAGKLLEGSEIVGAGGGVLGEIAAWYEGGSSFKNIVLRGVKEGGKAAVSITTSIVVGTSTAVSTWNPFFAGAAVIGSSMLAEEAYEATAGNYLNEKMNNEYRAAMYEKYLPDEEDLLFNRREVKRREAAKQYSKDIASKYDEYNAELEKYINERNQIWADYEKEMQEQAQKEFELQSAQNPSVVQVPNKKKIKPGETVTISVNTTGGLLPIKYSGVLDYTVKTGYDRNLVSYKWTPEKNIEPGVYEFYIKATSASKKVGSHTVTIEVTNPNPAPEPLANQNQNHRTDSDGERVYSASELNIKEIPGAETRKLIYKVNGIYYGHCQDPPTVKTQKFEIALGVDAYNNASKYGLAHFSQFAGTRTVQMSEEQKQKIMVKLGLPKNAPYPDYLDDFYKIYFHAWARDRKFDPVSGRIWGEIEGESSLSSTYIPKGTFTGNLEATLKNGVITGTITFTIGSYDYNFPFTAKQ